VSPYNLAVELAAVLTLGFSALAGALIPALRASSILPLDVWSNDDPYSSTGD
jgi:hypothetical protein